MGKDKLFSNRIYFFKRGIYYNPRNSRGYVVELGDVFERRLILYHELVQVMLDVQTRENLDVFVSIDKPEFIVVNRDYLKVTESFKTKQNEHLLWMFKDENEAAWICHKPIDVYMVCAKASHGTEEYG